MRYIGRKRRTRGHVIADLGVNHAERIVLQSGHTLERFSKDYGLDLVLFMYDNNGEYQNGDMRFQIKATEHVRPVRPSKNGTISCRLETAHLRHWLREPMPVILVVYDASLDVAYWLYVQEYFEGLGDQRLISEQKSVTVKVPIGNVLNDLALRRFFDFRDKILNQTLDIIRHHE